ncbi:hypothetical protein [Amycolatopsis sp.]|uniref:hypothetical protein n=1 Tax=Amycolatopsis sp. TaxID=37632 RepID=UPI002D803824|nr:hypothetical protein [Amycolatopsis sp.]HET6706947.1 hypothetical protein [Amycolatopsis sp.]
MVIDGWAAAMTGIFTGLGALYRDRHHGCLPELWPTDPGLYRFVTSVRNLQRHGWIVFPTAAGYIVAAVRGVFLVEHVATVDQPSGRRPHQRRATAAHDSAQQLGAALSVPVQAVMTVNSPTDEPRLTGDVITLPARHLVRALDHAPERLTPAELRSIVNRLGELLLSA